MALSQSDLDALEKALASGALSVQSPELGFITYRSVGELKQAIAYVREQLAATGASLSDAPSFASYEKC